MTDLLAALERAAGHLDSARGEASIRGGQLKLPEHQAEAFAEADAHAADAALLRELAQRITDYREAHAADQDEPYYDADLRRYRTRTALLALVRGGEAAPTPTTHEEAPTDNG
jgi:hypothetical protein